MIPNVDSSATIYGYTPGQPIPMMVRDPESGKVYVNPLKRFVKPFTLTTDPAEVTLQPNGLSDPLPMVIDNKGHFEIHSAYFSSEQPEGFTIEIFDPDNRPLLMNKEVHVATIASGGGVTTDTDGLLPATSSAGRPFRWPETFWMNVEEGGKAIMVRFRNLSASENTVRFCLHGLRWYHVQAPSRIADRMQHIYRSRLRSFPYFFTSDRPANLASLGTGDFTVRFGDEAWTEWIKGMSVSTGRYNVRIIETVTTKRFMDNAIRDDLVFGNGEFPFLMWESSLFEPNYKLTFELENLTESANLVYITLGCRRILFAPQDDRLLRPIEASGLGSEMR